MNIASTALTLHHFDVLPFLPLPCHFIFPNLPMPSSLINALFYLPLPSPLILYPITFLCNLTFSCPTISLIRILSYQHLLVSTYYPISELARNAHILLFYQHVILSPHLTLSSLTSPCHLIITFSTSPLSIILFNNRVGQESSYPLTSSYFILYLLLSSTCHLMSFSLINLLSYIFF